MINNGKDVLKNILEKGIHAKKEGFNFILQKNNNNNYANDSEEKIINLLSSSLLNYWVVSNPYKNNKEELCDCLIVFENDIIIISDKSYGYNKKATTSIYKKWANFCNGLSKSKRQLEDAMIYIKSNPEFVYTDNNCQNKAFLNIEIDDKTKFHLISTVSNWTNLIKEHLNNDGSMFLNTNVDFISKGETKRQERNIFSLQNIPEGTSFYHMFDEVNFEKIVKCINTPSDIISYLNYREKFIKGKIEIEDDSTNMTEKDILFPFVKNRHSKLIKRFMDESSNNIDDYCIFELIGKLSNDDFNLNEYGNYKKTLENNSFSDIESLNVLILGSLYYDLFLNYVSCFANTNIKTMSEDYNIFYEVIEDEIDKKILNERKCILDKLAKIDRQERVHICKSIHNSYKNIKGGNQNFAKPIETINYMFYFSYCYIKNNSRIEYTYKDIDKMHKNLCDEIIKKHEVLYPNKEPLVIVVDHPNGLLTGKLSYFCWH